MKTNQWLPVTNDSWDWISVRDRFQTLSDCLETPPDNHKNLANELRSIAQWIELQEQP